MTLKLINTIAQRAADRDGFSEADRRQVSDLGRTKAERAKIYKALDVFTDLIVTKRELGKFAHQLQLNANARSCLMGIVGHDGMNLLRRHFTTNPQAVYAKLIDLKSSAKIRSAAAAHIGKSNDPAAPHILTKALKTERDWFVRFAIAKALIGVDGRTRKRPDVITILVTAYRKGDAGVRAYVLSKLRDVRIRAVTDIFIDASKHRNPVVRSASIRTLAKNDDPKAKATLLKALKDTDERVRAAVPRSLALEVKRVGGLLKLLKSPKTRPEDRNYLIKQLSQVKEPVTQLVVAELAKLLKHRDTGMRLLAITALKSFRGENVVDALLPFLNDKKDKMRVMVVEYFARVGSVRGLVAALKNKYEGVRFRAMEGLAKVKKPFPYAPLLTALKDPLDIIKKSAIRLLATYKNAPVIAALIARLKIEPVRSIRMNIVRTLAGTSDAMAISALALQMERDPSDDVRNKIWGYLRSGLLNKFFDKRPVSKLLKDLTHPAFAIRMYAAGCLGRDGDMSVVSKLNARLQKEPNHNVKRSIDKALRSLAIKLFKTASVPKLFKALTHPTFAIRMYAAQRLGRDGDMSTIPKLNARLQKEPNEDVKSSIDKAIKLLATKSLEFASVSKLLKALVHPVTTVRLFAARLLRKCHDTSTVPTLLARLTKEPVTDVRIEIVHTLASISTENATITVALIKATRDPSPKVREIAVWSLSQKTGNGVISAFIKATKDPDQSVRYAAVLQLGGRNGPKIITALIKAFGDSSDQVQRIAVQSLISQWRSRRSSQEDRRRILTAIIAGSRARTRGLRYIALQVLAQMKHQKALQALAVSLKHPDKETRWYAERLFSEIGTNRYSWAIPSLTGLLKNRSKTIREDAGLALCRIGTESALLAALKSSDAEIRAVAVRKLGERTYPNASRTLISLLEDPAPVVQGAAFRALVDKKDTSVVPAIVKILSHPKAALRKDAVDILAERKDPASVIALASAIKSDDPYVCKIATRSLLKDVKSLQTLLAVLMKPKHRMYGVVADTLKKYKQYYKPMLGKMLRSKTYKWTLGAATALGIIGDADAVTELLVKLKRLPMDTEMQRHAGWDLVEIVVRALTRSKDPRVLPAFSKLLKERGSNIWPQVLRVLVRAKFPINHKAFYDKTDNKFMSEDITARLVQGLGKSGNIRAITEYMSLMRHWFTSRLWVVRSLVEMNDLRAVPILLKALAKAPHEEALKKALKRFARSEAIPHFAAALKAVFGEILHDKFIIKVLRTIGGPRVTSILLGLLPPKHSWTADIVHAAVEALGKIKDPRVEAKLIAIVKENGTSDWNFYDLHPYIKALGELGSKKAVPLIIDGLRALDEEMRGAAAMALGKIKDKSAVTALIERMLKDKEGSVRGLAARALGEIGDPRAIKALLRVSEKDTDEWVRNEALKALHKLPGQLIRAS